ncbi:hypothetical protein O0R46_00110 [Peptostreptococcus equinus]|uniref:Uncharacterized protein n=1 Tax=Peptostreptococcus equinus TaxID=3003601 RepID=A0ABY7JNI8_9FIRM|nr:hypothetical protein [Peptostreptococcus sp. CBA3647]WAW14936.1 hypothetical protein O0R46_00110 [Peptostreptococcus sp. CBA3647]
MGAFEIEEWKSRPLDAIYPVIYIDAVHFSVGDSGYISYKDKKEFASDLKSIYLSGSEHKLCKIWMV